MMMLPTFLAEVGSAGSFLNWLLAIGLTLFVLDLFICTEYLSWAALLLLASWATWVLRVPLPWCGLVFLAVLGVEFAFYQLLWVKAVRPLISRAVYHNAAPDVLEALIGKRGTVRGGQGNLCVRCGDELWPIHELDHPSLQEGDTVVITAFERGYVRVKHPSK